MLKKSGHIVKFCMCFALTNSLANASTLANFSYYPSDAEYFDIFNTTTKAYVGNCTLYTDGNMGLSCDIPANAWIQISGTYLCD